MSKDREKTGERIDDESTEVERLGIDEIADVEDETKEQPAVGESPSAEPDWEDRYIRLAAEFDNYKKRTAREYAQIIKNAEQRLITELTEVLDNFERALDPEHRNGGFEEFVKGIDLIAGQLKAVLEKCGLVRMKAVGEKFDPEKHEAMMQIDSADIPEGHVAGEIAPGYLLGDKVIRHAKVMVSKGPATDEEEEEEE